MIAQRLLKFGLVGLLNTSIGYLIILLLHWQLEANPVVSNMGGYLVGGAISYGLNKRFTFKDQSAHGTTMPRFAAAWAACFALNILVLQTCIKVVGMRVEFAQAISITAFTVAFFLANQWLVFRDQRI
jgi:putative flippase GtrA